MKLEKFKTIFLTVLVFISIILTTRIWLDISIEGFFVMSRNKENLSIEENYPRYDKAILAKPRRIILNNSGKHTLLMNNTEIGSIYARIMSDAREILKAFINNKGQTYLEVYPIEFLSKLRSRRNVEIQFPFSYDIRLITDLIGADKAGTEGITSVDSIIIAYDNNQFYLLDKSESSIYEFDIIDSKSSIRSLVELADKGNLQSYIFLSDIDSDKYGEDVFIPISATPYRLPKLSALSEVSDKSAEEIANHFFTEDLSTIRSIVDPSGTIIYTDGIEKGIKIEFNGLLEYVSYSYQLKPVKTSISIENSVSLASEFINRHLGFPDDAFISSVEPIINNEKVEGHKIRYGYCYDGIPIINDNIGMDNPIEIEIRDGEVRSFKRLIRNITETEDVKDIKDPLEIIDIIYKRVEQDKNVDTSHIKIADIYLSYFEYDYDNKVSMIPVWIVYIEKEDSINDKYILNAESGVILSEPYKN